MKNNFRRDTSSFQYKFVLGFFIAVFVLGLILTAATYDLSGYVTWLLLAGDIFMAFTIYCWIDEKRYQKYEHYMLPVLFTLFFLLLIFFAIGGLYMAYLSYTKDSSVSDALARVFGSICCAVFAYFSFVFYILPYFKKDKDQ